MNIKRSTSFIIIALIYVFASVIGIMTYDAVPGEPWSKLLIADVAATVFTFIFSVMLGNASVYDPYWSVQPIVIVFALAFAEGVTPAGAILIAVITLWGIRLTLNWAYTFHGLAHQDWRYTMLKEKTGALYPLINFIGIHMVPTLVVYGCTLPATFVITNGARFSPLCIFGFFISVFAVILQGTADIQMHKYRKNRPSPFIRTGLWKHSRHPNYLAEILMWWGVATFTVSLLGFKWYYVAGAVANTALFLFVSIPLADGRQSKKEGFVEYKSHTRMLLPIKK